MERSRLKVGILGATGRVGQKLVAVLEDHPWFEVAVVAASGRSTGQRYGDVVPWGEPTPIPAAVADLVLEPAQPPFDCDFIISALDAAVAGEIESACVTAGHPVVSNARTARMRPEVPLLVPEVNPEHVELVRRQRPGPGYIVTNPNCTTTGLVCALKPLDDAFGVEEVQLTTLQAISGAGYPGLPALDVLGNVVPFIPGEEEKLETEPKKILGRLHNGRIEPSAIRISAQATRVPVVDGHLLTVSVRLGRRTDRRGVAEVLGSFRSPLVEEGLPSAPPKLLQLFERDEHPQPRLHAQLGGGMTVGVGRVRECPVLDYRFVVLVHNTIRGAAGGALLNAELLRARGLLVAREPRRLAHAARSVARRDLSFSLKLCPCSI